MCFNVFQTECHVLWCMWAVLWCMMVLSCTMLHHKLSCMCAMVWLMPACTTTSYLPFAFMIRIHHSHAVQPNSVPCIVIESISQQNESHGIATFNQRLNQKDSQARACTPNTPRSSNSLSSNKSDSMRKISTGGIWTSYEDEDRLGIQHLRIFLGIERNHCERLRCASMSALLLMRYHQ